MVDVWRDGWFQVPEEGKSAEIWMDDDRRDAKMDEHERVEGDKRAGVRACVNGSVSGSMNGQMGDG